MQRLVDVQRRLVRSIVTRTNPDVSFLAGSPADVGTRFEIHRRHFRQSLTRGLEKIYPAVMSLVERRFFAFCADAFIEATPPAEPCLFNYGAKFADFLKTFEPCSSLPYLPYVARLEWDIHAVFHELGCDSSPGSLWIAPGLRLLHSHFPVHHIWQVARGEADGPVDVSSGQSWLVVYQDDDDVSVDAVAPAVFVFLDALRARRSFAQATFAARDIDPKFRAKYQVPAAVVRLLPVATLKPPRGSNQCVKRTMDD